MNGCLFLNVPETFRGIRLKRSIPPRQPHLFSAVIKPTAVATAFNLDLILEKKKAIFNAPDKTRFVKNVTIYCSASKHGAA